MPFGMTTARAGEMPSTSAAQRRAASETKTSLSDDDASARFTNRCRRRSSRLTLCSVVTTGVPAIRAATRPHVSPANRCVWTTSTSGEPGDLEHPEGSAPGRSEVQTNPLLDEGRCERAPAHHRRHLLLALALRTQAEDQPLGPAPREVTDHVEHLHGIAALAQGLL
jgi:hypothetical protein